MVTVPMVQMKQTVVVQHVLMVNMTVVLMVVHMVSVFMAHGHVTVMKTVMMAVMKVTALPQILVMQLAETLAG
jgi:hypothetical protein